MSLRESTEYQELGYTMIKPGTQMHKGTEPKPVQFGWDFLDRGMPARGHEHSWRWKEA